MHGWLAGCVCGRVQQINLNGSLVFIVPEHVCLPCLPCMCACLVFILLEHACLLLPALHVFLSCLLTP